MFLLAFFPPKLGTNIIKYEEVILLDKNWPKIFCILLFYVLFASFPQDYEYSENRL